MGDFQVETLKAQENSNIIYLRFLFVCVLVVLESKVSALCMLGKLPATELQPSFLFAFNSGTRSY